MDSETVTCQESRRQENSTSQTEPNSPIGGVPVPGVPVPPAQLWIGHLPIITEQVEKYLQKIWCKTGGCSWCTQCTHIRQRTHHALLWITPGSIYSTEQIEQVLHKMSFMLDEEEHFFFIFELADRLTTASGSQLLKSIEEPPPGYHFILLTERPDALLPTTISRCHVQTWYQKGTVPANELVTLFIAPVIDTIAAMNLIEKNELDEKDSLSLIDLIIEKIFATGKELADTDHTKKLHKRIAILSRELLRPPMPGSSKLLWKNILLQITVNEDK